MDRSYRFTFDFFKQSLQWTRPKLRSPDAAERWTWLLILACVQLRLVRDEAAGVRLPWQPPLTVERRTPVRVRWGFFARPPAPGQPREIIVTL